MRSFKNLQTKYELSIINEAINDHHLKLVFEALAAPAPVAGQAPAQPAPVAAQAPAQPAPAPVAQTPQDLEKEVEADPKQLPELIQAIVSKLNPEQRAELQNIVAKNDVQALQAFVAQHAAHEENTHLEEQVSTIFEYVESLPNKEEIHKGLQEFVESKGDVEVLKKYDPNYEENLLGFYKEGYLQEGFWSSVGKGIKTVGKSLWKGIKNVGKEAVPVLAKYGPWAALGALAGGGLGAMALPLIAKALSGGGSAANKATNKDTLKKEPTLKKGAPNGTVVQFPYSTGESHPVTKRRGKWYNHYNQEVGPGVAKTAERLAAQQKKPAANLKQPAPAKQNVGKVAPKRAPVKTAPVKPTKVKTAPSKGAPDGTVVQKQAFPGQPPVAMTKKNGKWYNSLGKEVKAITDELEQQAANQKATTPVKAAPVKTAPVKTAKSPVKSVAPRKSLKENFHQTFDTILKENFDGV